MTKIQLGEMGGVKCNQYYEKNIFRRGRAETLCVFGLGFFFGGVVFLLGFFGRFSLLMTLHSNFHSRLS